jgi:hypothetical protein
MDGSGLIRPYTFYRPGVFPIVIVYDIFQTPEALCGALLCLLTCIKVKQKLEATLAASTNEHPGRMVFVLITYA